MALLTEGEIRNLLKGKDLKTVKELEIPKGAIVTPSAKGFLTDHQIQLKYIEPAEKKTAESPQGLEESKKEHTPYRYTTLFGGYMDKKPEHMTSLYGNVLVFKDHKRIIFRGKIDSFESRLLETQIAVEKLGHPKLVADLQEILLFVRNLLRCEVLGEKVQEFSLQKMNHAELREMSHHPEKYFGSGHFIPDYIMGEVVVRLNALRSAVREVELAAYEAFKLPDGDAGRGDIILALNRLSSLFYIMMFKFMSGQYKS
ncbi:cobalamin adenosyltransferase [Schinkia azotoformans]|uniref:cobalamin adenosyltransferase n=1 Tax=Schinkia azotoformans TaxID=1454 RepID=UPI002E228FE3|nr:cobalamin adenosyltransferase [Schinkia azotoformans]